MNRIFRKISYLYHRFLYLFYGKKGKKTKVIKPMRIIGRSHMYLGDNVIILNNARMETVNGYWGDRKYDGKLVIGDGTSIEQSCHIIAAGELMIGKNCVFSANVYVSDCNHKYGLDKPIMQQELEVKETIIGDNVFIGIGARIMPGVHIGDHAVVGANAVVTKDVEERKIVAGVPARVIGEVE